jgi:hypothetical protein
MRADNIAALGRVGKIAATSIASSGRIGRNILLLIIPVDYTPFTLVTVRPAVYEADILASEFFVKIVEVEGKSEIVAGYVYAIAFDHPVDVETLIESYDAWVVPVEQYEVDVLTKEGKVEVIDG